MTFVLCDGYRAGMSLSFDIIFYIFDLLVIYGSRYKTASVVCKKLYNHLKMRFPTPNIEFGEFFSTLQNYPSTECLFGYLSLPLGYYESLAIKQSDIDSEFYAGMKRIDVIRWSGMCGSEMNVWLSQDITLDFVLKNKHLNWNFGSIVANPYITNDNNLMDVVKAIQPFLMRNHCKCKLNQTEENPSVLCVHWPMCLLQNVNISIDGICRVIEEGFVHFRPQNTNIAITRLFFDRMGIIPQQIGEPLGHTEYFLAFSYENFNNEFYMKMLESSKKSSKFNRREIFSILNKSQFLKPKKVIEFCEGDRWNMVDVWKRLE